MAKITDLLEPSKLMKKLEKSRFSEPMNGCIDEAHFLSWSTFLNLI